MRSKTLAIVTCIAVIANAIIIHGIHADEYYRYDFSGNIVERRIGEDRMTMFYNNINQVVGAQSEEGSQSYEYDSSGALVSEKGKEGSVRYKRGYLSRIRQVKREKGIVRVLYNHQGYPAGKASGTRTVSWVWEGNDMVVRGNEVIEGQLRIRDFLGNGFEAAGRDDSAFAVASNRTFTGKIYDDELGVYLFPYRFFHPGISRWMAADPLGYPDGSNTYAYAPVPTLSADALGLVDNLTATKLADSPTKINAGGGISAFGVTNPGGSSSPSMTKTQHIEKPTTATTIDNGGKKCYTATASQGFTFSSPAITYQVVGVGIIDYELITAAFRGDVLTHELDHVRAYRAIVNATYGVLETKSAAYTTEKKQNKNEAKTAIETDGNQWKSKTDTEFSSKWSHRLDGHNVPTANKIEIQDQDDYNWEWEYVGPTQWADSAVSYFESLGFDSKLTPSQASCEN